MKNSIFNKLFVILIGMLILMVSYTVFNRYNQTKKYAADFEANKDLQVIIYSKDLCTYCIQAKTLLDSMHVKYEVVDLTNNREMHVKLAEKTGQNTVPYIYINNKFIGGYQDLKKFAFKTK